MRPSWTCPMCKLLYTSCSASNLWSSKCHEWSLRTNENLDNFYSRSGRPLIRKFTSSLILFIQRYEVHLNTACSLRAVHNTARLRSSKAPDIWWVRYSVKSRKHNSIPYTLPSSTLICLKLDIHILGGYGGTGSCGWVFETWCYLADQKVNQSIL